jgi:hypothetical protein
VEASLGIRLLTDLRSIFEGEQELPSKAILDRLQGLPESPWGEPISTLVIFCAPVILTFAMEPSARQSIVALQSVAELAAVIAFVTSEGGNAGRSRSRWPFPTDRISHGDERFPYVSVTVLNLVAGSSVSAKYFFIGEFLSGD